MSPEKPLTLRDGDTGSIDLDEYHDDDTGDTVKDFDLSVNSEKLVDDRPKAGTQTQDTKKGSEIPDTTLKIKKEDTPPVHQVA